MTDRVRIRIGDADRDAAVSTLGEHYAAGRLTKDEYDERIEQAWAATFHHDLDPLFTDLPGGNQPRVAQWTPERPQPGAGSRAPFRPPVPWVFAILPVFAIAGVIGLVIVAGAPWILFGLFWLFACGGFGRRHARASHRW